MASEAANGVNLWRGLVVAIGSMLALAIAGNWTEDADRAERITRLEEAIRFGPVDITRKVDNLDWRLEALERSVSGMQSTLTKMESSLMELRQQLQRTRGPESRVGGPP